MQLQRISWAWPRTGHPLRPFILQRDVAGQVLNQAGPMNRDFGLLSANFLRVRAAALTSRSSEASLLSFWVGELRSPHDAPVLRVMGGFASQAPSIPAFTWIIHPGSFIQDLAPGSCWIPNLGSKIHNPRSRRQDSGSALMQLRDMFFIEFLFLCSWVAWPAI